VGATVGLEVGPGTVAGTTGAGVGVAPLVVVWVGTGVAGAAPAQATTSATITTTTAIVHAPRFLMPINTSLTGKSRGCDVSLISHRRQRVVIWHFPLQEIVASSFYHASHRIITKICMIVITSLSRCQYYVTKINIYIVFLIGNRKIVIDYADGDFCAAAGEDKGRGTPC
jgi:hypothetical protein